MDTALTVEKKFFELNVLERAEAMRAILRSGVGQQAFELALPNLFTRERFRLLVLLSPTLLADLEVAVIRAEGDDDD